MTLSRALFIIMSMLLWLNPATSALGNTADNAKVTILSTNLSDGGIGEWGFAALAQVDGRCILFDTGLHPDTVIRNAETLNLDLSCVTDVVISHFHGDHTGGLLALLNKYRSGTSRAFSRLHVGKGIFNSRPRSNGLEANRMIAAKAEIEALGVTIVEHESPTEIAPGIWVTGNVPRPHTEKNYNTRGRAMINGAVAEDTIQEDMALTIVTSAGHIVLVGCGHAGIINTLTHVTSEIADRPIQSVIGGLHLFRADEATLAWTAEHFIDLQVQNLMGAHCTGIEAVMRLREKAKLSRETAVVAAIGASFISGTGIDPGAIAR